jgi:hypothetical protein
VRQTFRDINGQGLELRANNSESADGSFGFYAFEQLFGPAERGLYVLTDVIRGNHVLQLGVANQLLGQLPGAAKNQLAATLAKLTSSRANGPVASSAVMLRKNGAGVGCHFRSRPPARCCCASRMHPYAISMSVRIETP